MKRYEPYFAADTDGVLFEVCVDGSHVQAHIGRQVLARGFSVVAADTDWVAVYLTYRPVIDACVERRVRQHGTETVIVQLDELAASVLVAALRDRSLVLPSNSAGTPKRSM